MAADDPEPSVLTPVLEQKVDLLIGGGASDPNIRTLIAAAQKAGKTVLPVLHAQDREPCIDWDLTAGTLRVDGFRVKASGVFLRYDVFNQVSPGPAGIDRALAWYSTLAGWAAASRTIKQFNLQMKPAAANKSIVLHDAGKSGIPVPRSLISNNQREICKFDASPVVKPVGGGAYCSEFYKVDQITEWQDGAAPAPVIVQEKLSYPEYRVFVVGPDMHTFRIQSDNLDHRSDRSSDVNYVGPGFHDGDYAKKLRAFAGRMGLDFCAFDLKTRAADGTLCLLEVNSGPMFAAFDARSKGCLCQAIVEHLTS